MNIIKNKFYLSKFMFLFLRIKHYFPWCFIILFYRWLWHRERIMNKVRTYFFSSFISIIPDFKTKFSGKLDKKNIPLRHYLLNDTNLCKITVRFKQRSWNYFVKQSNLANIKHNIWSIYFLSIYGNLFSLQVDYIFKYIYYLQKHLTHYITISCIS